MVPQRVSFYLGRASVACGGREREGLGDRLAIRPPGPRRSQAAASRKILRRLAP